MSMRRAKRTSAIDRWISLFVFLSALCIVFFVTEVLASQKAQSNASIKSHKASDAELDMQVYSRNLHAWIEGNSIDATFVPAASIFPDAGRLILESGSGNIRLSTCSGVMISSSHFLTAAHCVCRSVDGTEYKTHQSCLASRALMMWRASILLPRYGLLKLSGEPIIHQDYDIELTSERESIAGRRRADLAILKLDAPIPSSGSKVGAYNAIYEKIVSHGYGRIAFSPTAAHQWSVPPQRTFSPGVGTTKVVRHDLPPCESTPSFSDAVCDVYTASSGKGPFADAVACGGDSGGPLFGIMPSDGIHSLGSRVRVIGVTASGDNQCGILQEIATQWVALDDYYISWIQRIIAESEDVLDDASDFCEEAVYTEKRAFERKVTNGSSGVVWVGLNISITYGTSIDVSLRTTDSRCFSYRESIGSEFCVLKPAGSVSLLNAGIQEDFNDQMGVLIQLVKCSTGYQEEK